MIVRPFAAHASRRRSVRIGMSHFSTQFKLKPEIDDDHQVMEDMSNDLWFRGMEVEEEGQRNKSYGFAKETGGEEMADLDSLSSSIRHGRF